MALLFFVSVVSASCGGSRGETIDIVGDEGPEADSRVLPDLGDSRAEVDIPPDGGPSDVCQACDLPRPGDSVEEVDVVGPDGVPDAGPVPDVLDAMDLMDGANDDVDDQDGDLHEAGQDVEVTSEFWPPPSLEPEVAQACQAALDDPWYYQFLDNLCGEKVWPGEQDRDRMCPVDAPSPLVQLTDGSLVEYQPSSAGVTWDTAALDGLLPPGMKMVVIEIIRVNGVPHYRYLSNGFHSTAMQPWSTTKVFAAANAASVLRIESDYEVGLTATAGDYQLGDLVTSLCNYDESPFSSNGLGRWFHNIGGRQRANDLIHGLWLGMPENETFGGNYGEAAPAISYNFVEASGASVNITPDSASGFANNLSLFTLAEALKRLVLHREEPDLRLPGIQWKDISVLLYGAEVSPKYGSWGGMTQDTAIYLQAGHDMNYIEARSQGQWTIFSKLGLGTNGQFIHMGYACWPVLDQAGLPVPSLGREFIIAAHLDQGGADWAARDRLMANAYRTVIIKIVDGSL